MTKHYRILFTLGLIIFILPFLGIPDTFKISIEFAVGLILIIISSLYRYWYREDKKGHDEAIFEESNGESEEAVSYHEEEIVEEEEIEDMKETLPQEEVKEEIIDEEKES